MSSPAPPASSLRLRIVLGYDGTEFHGWAPQAGLRTVAGVLREGLERLLGEAAVGAIVGAGRTDAGVHARGQVAHVDVEQQAWARVERSFRQRSCAVLPPDVTVHACAAAPVGFDARFSALAREYTYTIATPEATVDPLLRRHIVQHRHGLDAGAMQAAAARLLGEHDFAAFCRARPEASTVRELHQFSWRVTRPGLLIATVAADAFCHGMVRALVGACLLVGAGRQPVEWPRALLAGRARDPRVSVAPAHGLVLERVTYPPDVLLAERAARVRAAGRRVAPPTPFAYRLPPAVV